MDNLEAATEISSFGCKSTYPSLSSVMEVSVRRRLRKQVHGLSGSQSAYLEMLSLMC